MHLLVVLTRRLKVQELQLIWTEFAGQNAVFKQGGVNVVVVDTRLS